MNTLRRELNSGDSGFAGEGLGRYALSYPEVCSGFLTALSRAVKSSALYSLTHPVVTEALGKAYAMLKEIFATGGEERMTLTFMNDSWLFNETQVPAMTPDAQNLNSVLKAHGAAGVTFLRGATLFELGVLCELLGTSPKGQPAGYFEDFMAQRGVSGIRAETVRYVKERQYGTAPAVRTADRSPRPAAAIPAPGIPPRPAAHLPAAFPSGTAAPQAAAAGKPAAGQGAGAPGQGGRGGTAGSGGPGGAGGAANVLAGMSLGSLLTNLVESAVRDPHERVKVYEDALKMIKESLQQQVEQSTQALVKEKEQILNTRNRTEQVLAKVAEGKVIVDKDGKILMMNPAAEEISGKRLIDVAGQHVSKHLNTGDHFLTISEDMDLTNGAPLSGQISVTGDEHVGQALRRSMALLEDDEGRVIGAYATLPDITKFRETQRLQEEFLSKITHELQSPLSSISSALEMLTDTAVTKLDPDEEKFLAISVRNSRRLTELIRSILDFSKLQSGRLSVHPEPADLGPILAEAGDGLLPWAKTKGINLVVRQPQQPILALADGKRVVQILTNLISNAIKSTPRSGTVLVAASRAANPEPCVIIGVRDTGPGISKEGLNKIFAKFVQLESSEPREGVGLGLSIVRELVSLHGGKTWAESELGKGATFYFTLPLAEDRPEPD